MSKPTLKELLSTKFKAGFSYVAWIRYGDRTSVSVAGSTLESFLNDTKTTRAFYEKQGHTTKIEETVIICNTCSGSGQIIMGVYKSGPYKNKSKFKKCSDCKGLGRVKLE